MSKGLSKTFNYLLRTRNDAAVEVLIAGLESAHPTVRSQAIKSIARRNQLAAHLALMKRLGRLSDEDCDLLAKIDHRMHHSMVRAIRGEEGTLCQQAGKLALMIREYELFPVLIELAEDPQHPASSNAAATLVRLASQLRDESNLPVESSKKDPFFARRKAIDRMGKSLNRFHEHKRLEILDAYLLLTSHDHPFFKRLIYNPHHPCHEQLVSTLRSSRVPGIIRILVEMMRDTQSSLDFLKIFAERKDQKFLNTALSSIGLPVPLRVLENMGRLRHIAWLQEDRKVWFSLKGPEQAVAVQLATAAGIESGQLLDLLSDMMTHGAPEGKAACCHALDEFRTSRADALVQQGLDDEDERVRAAATAQLRRRSMPGALPTLLSLIDSDEETVKEAAKSSLSDYTFTSYVSEYDSMSELKRRSRGEIVGKCDPKAVHNLKREFSSPSLSIRRRAIEMAIYLLLIDEVIDSLAEIMLNPHEELSLRIEATETLALSKLQKAHDALQKATKDPQSKISDLAKQRLPEVSIMPQINTWNSDSPGANTW